MERLLHELLTNSCHSYPHKTALRFKDSTLSYQDLDRESIVSPHCLWAME